MVATMKKSVVKRVKLPLPIEGLPALEVAVVMLTPELAAEWLTKNVSNRRPKPKHIKELYGAVSRGEYELNGQTVIFDTNDHLLDGQNRLYAVVKAGDACPPEGVPTLVVWGARPGAFKTIDQHSIRTARDTLFVASRKKLKKIVGDAEASQEAFAGYVSNAVRMAFAVREEDKFFTTRKLTNRQIQSEMEYYSNKKNVSVTVIDAVKEAIDADRYLGVRSNLSLTIVCGLYFLMVNADEKKARAFLAEFAYDDKAKVPDGEEKPKKIEVSPVVAKLKSLLRKNRKEPFLKRTDVPDMVAAAWNVFCDDPKQTFAFKPTEEGEPRWHIGGPLDEIPTDVAPEEAEEADAELVEA